MPRPAVRIAASHEIAGPEQARIRALLDAAFDGDFSDDDWAHALGGTHAIVADADGIVAHAAVVPRVLDVGTVRLTAGYVEAVAVRPDRQRAGLGTGVMRAVGELIARDYPLGVLSTGAWGFYRRTGWERWHGEAWVRHPDGRRERTPDDDDSLMILRTPSSPAIDPAWPMTCEARPGDAW
nr:GCN5-related N-acetyltransferase [uncultured bacterium]